MSKTRQIFLIRTSILSGKEMCAWDYPDPIQPNELFNSNDSEDVFERMTPGSPKRFDEHLHRDIFTHHHRVSRGSADHEPSYHIRDENSLDSPISQVRWLSHSLANENKNFFSSTSLKIPIFNPLSNLFL